MMKERIKRRAILCLSLLLLLPYISAAPAVAAEAMTDWPKQVDLANGESTTFLLKDGSQQSCFKASGRSE